jgi:hypothetical protein
MYLPGVPRQGEAGLRSTLVIGMDPARLEQEARSVASGADSATIRAALTTPRPVPLAQDGFSFAKALRQICGLIDSCSCRCRRRMRQSAWSRCALRTDGSGLLPYPRNMKRVCPPRDDPITRSGTTAMIRSHVLTVAALLSLAASSVCQAAPITNVVFGNLGASGTNGVTDFSQAISDDFRMAQGFTAASPNLTVQSVSLWLSGSSTTASVQIYDAESIIPPGGPGDPIATSNSQTINAKGLYQFSFGGVDLTNGTNYWIVPNGDVSWYLADGAPTQQNVSGYAYTGTLQRSFQWEPAGTNAVSVSISVVPEPSACALAALGFGVAGVARWRRCRPRGGC